MAISKERLKELISQKATIWHDDYGEIKLNEECEICKVTPVKYDVVIGYLLFGKIGKYNYELDIEELEEDIETAKWKYEIHSSRTEYFKPPTWEEFKGKFNREYRCLGLDGYFINIYYGDYNLIKVKYLTKYFEAPATKENYTKAVLYAKALFLRGEE